MSKILELKFKDQRTGREKITGKLEIKNKDNDSAELYIYGDIVSSSWAKWDDTDVCPDDVKNFLDSIEGKNKLDVYINSGGGSVFAGLAIYNQLKRSKAYKVAHIDGVAASISSTFPFACDEIIYPSNAFLMIHKPWSWVIGNANDMRKGADDLDRIEEGIMNIYKENLKDGVDIETIQELVNAETWLTGEEAAKYFNIEVEEANNAVACISDYYAEYKNLPKTLKEKPKEEQPKDDIEKEKFLLELDLL